jgi:outer membrane protein OmpA-like peptidoglycan-associated protein
MKKIVLSLAVLLGSLALNAQVNKLNDSKFIDNTYIQLNGGESWDLKNNHFTWRTFNPIVGVKAGNNITPIFGGELDVEAITGESKRTAFNSTNVSLNATMNLSNLIAGYKGFPRFFELVAFVGPGWYHTYGDYVQNSVSLKGGLSFDFNLSNRIQLNVISDYTYLTKYGKLDNSYISLKGGITYKLGSHFSYGSYYSQQDIDSLNNSINDLHNTIVSKNNKIKELSIELSRLEKDSTQEITIIQEVDSPILNTAIGFSLNSSELEETQLAALDLIVKYVKDSVAGVTISGYADKETGSSEYNYLLATKRAIAVRDYLKSKGVSNTNIISYGDYEQPFSDPILNRVVIINIK